MANARTAWIAIERERTAEGSPSLDVQGAPSLQSAIAEDDWILVVTPDGGLLRVGRVLRTPGKV